MLIAVGLYAGCLVIAVIVGVVAALAGGFDVDALGDTFDLYRPLDFTISMLAVILMLPAIWLGFRLAGCNPAGLLSSVAGRLRWRWLLRCLIRAGAVLAVTFAVDLTTTLALAPAGEEIDWRPAPTGSLILVLVILLLTPLQAAAEEYVFRGALMQTIGAWLRHPAWAILLPTPLFVLGHLYDLPGQLSVGVFAVAAGWITWRTGGLEAAIALHVVNNLVALLVGAAGFFDLNATGAGWWAAVVSALVPIGYVLWVDAIWRRDARIRR